MLEKEEKPNNIEKSKEIEIKGEINCRKDEIYTGHKPIPINIINKVLKSICKINIIKNKGIQFGTGFFMKINNSTKFIITNYHIISEDTKIIKKDEIKIR